MSKIIDLDKIADEFDITIKFCGVEMKVSEPNMSAIEALAKIESLEEKEHIPVIRKFMEQALPDVTEDQLSTVSLRQAKALMDGIMSEINKDPTEAAEEN